jgi:hypothetical protein
MIAADVNNLQEQQRHGSRFVTEIRAGLTTFFTMAYIIAVNVSFEARHIASYTDDSQGVSPNSKRGHMRLHRYRRSYMR